MESKIEKLELGKVIKSDRFWSAGMIIEKINELIDAYNSQSQPEEMTEDRIERARKKREEYLKRFEDTLEEKEELTKEEWFMLKLAVNEIHNKGNGAYDEISRKIDRLSKLNNK